MWSSVASGLHMSSAADCEKRSCPYLRAGSKCHHLCFSASFLLSKQIQEINSEMALETFTHESDAIHLQRSNRAVWRTGKTPSSGTHTQRSLDLPGLVEGLSDRANKLFLHERVQSIVEKRWSHEGLVLRPALTAGHGFSKGCKETWTCCSATASCHTQSQGHYYRMGSLHQVQRSRMVCGQNGPHSRHIRSGVGPGSNILSCVQPTSLQPVLDFARQWIAL